MPNGKSATETPLTDTSVDDIIFGYSRYSSDNVLIINGISIPLLSTGWFTSQGKHTLTNDNYVCGQIEEDFYRNFFAVDLSNLITNYGITLPITSALLKINKFGSEPATGEKEFTLYSTSTPYSKINQSYTNGSTTGVNIFNDLGSGNILASTMIDRTTSNIPIEIPLNSTAIDELNASIGSTFVLGGKADNLKPVPVSIWAIVLIFGLISLTLFLRFRKRIFIS